MNFRLAVVGHRSSIDDIRWIVSEKFDNVDTVGVEFANDEMIEDAAARIVELLPRIDGLLYTRREPYELIISRIDHGGVPARFVDVDAPSFVQGLLIAKLKYDADIRRVSVDTLDYDTVMRALGSLEIPLEQVHPTVVRVDITAEHFVEATAHTHMESYQNGLCSVCLTNIRDVQETLLARGIPCVLMTPSPENYIHEIRRLILKWREQREINPQSAVICIRAEQKSDYLQYRSLVQTAMEAEKLAEMVVMFSQMVGGICVREGTEDYVVICDQSALADHTDNFTHLDLLAQVFSETSQKLAVGVGTGQNLPSAMSNARQACLLARMEGWNRGYWIGQNGERVGPIQPNELLYSKKAEFDHQLAKVASDCGLSINTVVKIDSFAHKKSNSSFITADLGQELHVSFRTAARIVEKLEKHGYIVEVGKTAINDRGRPTRIFRLLW